jgi:hypothetical protein
MAERSMLDLAQAVRAQIIRETAPKVAERRFVTIRGLGRLAIWGGTAAAALSVAVIASRSEIGSQRMATALLHDGQAQAGTRTADADAETRRLADAVRGLVSERDQINSRLAAVEHDMDDVTGSVSRQIAAVSEARRSETGPTVSAVAAATTTLVPTTVPPPGTFPSASATTPSPADNGPPAATAAAEYGADIGSGLTIQALRVRWAAIRSAHPELFDGLEPIVSVKEVAHANRVELRLVVGPFAKAGEAGQLCASVALFGLFCQPTIFDGQRLAVR